MEDLKNMKINDDMLKDVVGGVGGIDEATCPVCGNPMTKSINPYGSDSWVCPDPNCNQTQFLSDAEYIQFLKAAEATGQTQGLTYPVWWDEVKDKF